MNAWIATIDDPATGYRYVGPFATKEEAENWIDANVDEGTDAHASPLEPVPAH